MNLEINYAAAKTILTATQHFHMDQFVKEVEFAVVQHQVNVVARIMGKLVIQAPQSADAILNPIVSVEEEFVYQMVNVDANWIMIVIWAQPARLAIKS